MSQRDFGIPGNIAKMKQARAVLAARSSLTDQERFERHKARSNMDEVQASRAGVVTIQQAEVTFMELNKWAYDELGNAFIEVSPLAFGQQAVYKTEFMRDIRVNLGNLGGGPPSQQWATATSHVTVPTFEWFSEQVNIPNLVNTSYDLSMFNLKEKALKQLDHNMSLFRQLLIINMMLGQPLTQPLATSLANYFASTPFAGRLPFVLDAQIAANSVPNTNILSSLSSGGLDKNVFKQQRTWANQMERELQKMFIPVAGAPWEAYWNQASIVGYSSVGTSNLDTTKAIPASKWEEAENMSFRRNGAAMNWFGSDIFVQPTNILPADYAIISTDQPAVLGWDKLQDAVSMEYPIQGAPNMNSRFEKRSGGFAQPDVLIPNFVLQKFA